MWTTVQLTVCCPPALPVAAPVAPETPRLALKVEREGGVEEEGEGRRRWGRRRRTEFWRCRPHLPIIEESDDS